MSSFCNGLYTFMLDSWRIAGAHFTRVRGQICMHFLEVCEEWVTTRSGKIALLAGV